MEIKKDSNSEQQSVLTNTKNRIEVFKKNLEQSGDDSNDGLIKDVSEALKFIDIEIQNLRCFNYEDYKNCNVQYQKYYETRFQNIRNCCDFILKYGCENNNQLLKTKSFYLKQLNDLIGSEANYNLFEQFKYGDSNYVLFGKNGAGKTTLLNYLAKNLINSNVHIAPSNRNINYSNNAFCNLNSITKLNNALNLNNHEALNTLYYLSILLLKKERKELEKGIQKEETILGKFYRIFNSLGLERQIEIDENYEIKLLVSGGNYYSFSFASDGEKTVAYFIMLSLLASENSFVFIDEPENHLNASLMVKLFDKLELERKDIKFVYSTHNINFVKTRTNCNLIYLQKTTEINHREFKQLSEFQDLPYEVILSIEGTNDDILLCEGRRNSSYDEQFLSIIYPSLKIISNGGCENVINTTKSINIYSKELRKRAYGIIDNDFKEENVIKKLKNDNIYVLSCNEIENMFILEPCLTLISNHLKSEKSIKEIKKQIAQIIKTKKNHILSDFACKKIRLIYHENKLENIDNIENSLKDLNNRNSEKFKNIYSEFKKKLEKAIDNCEYDSLMKLVPGKMIIADVAKQFGLSGEDTYIKLLFKLLIDDNQLKKELELFIGMSNNPN